MSSPLLGGPLVAGAHVAYRDTKSGGILVNMVSGTCFELNHVAADVWKYLATGETIENVALTMSSRYQAPLETVLDDVRRICSDFAVAELLEQHDR
jgi:hypothetical protein